MMNSHAIIENVSRRFVLKGVAAAGALIVGGRFLSGRSALAYATGAGAMPHGTVNDPHVFIAIDDYKRSAGLLHFLGGVLLVGARG